MNFAITIAFLLGCPTSTSSTVVEHGVLNTNSGRFLGRTVVQPNATVGSVDVDSFTPSDEHYSPDADIVADVAVDGRQREDRRLQYTAPESCPGDEYVLYKDGSATNGTCGNDDCCVGVNACYGFSGCVKKDGSCVGTQACYNLKANVVEGSCKGLQACNAFGTARNITNSCTNGDYVCRYFALSGQAGDVTNSCNDGNRACYLFAYKGGQVGDVTDSCSNRNEMCIYFAQGGQVGDVTNSCTDSGLSCTRLFQNKGNGADIVNHNAQASSLPGAPMTSPTNPLSSAPTSSPTSTPTTSPSKAPASTRADLPFSWDIESSVTTVAFGDDSLDKEVQISYNISNKDYKVTVMTESCTSVVSTDIISVNTTKVSSPTHIQLNVSADINLTAVVGSAVWTTPTTANSDLAYIDFCLRLDLLYDGTSMNFLERDISLQLNMTSESFDVTASDINRTEGQAVDEEVDAAYVVEACQCMALLQCVTTPDEKTLTQGDSLYLCLKASTAEIIVSGVKTLTISQTSSGGSAVTQNLVADGQTNALTLVTPISDVINDNELSIRTQLISGFFGQDAAPLIVSGVAQLSFKNGRKLLAEVVDVRNLQQETQDPLSAQFNIAVNLKSNDKGENVFSDGTRVDVSYAFPVIYFVVVMLLPIVATNCM